ncbi:MAG: ABC transporter permease [Dehalococcoidia bacterium]
MTTSQYILRRLLLMVPVIIGASLVVFFFLRIAPGDVVDLILGDAGTYSEERAQELRDQLGLSDPYWKQYLTWVADMARGDFGTSLFTGRSVLGAIKDRAPVTIELSILALSMSILLSVGLGSIAAYTRGSVIDFSIRLIAVLMLMPSFWLATLAILVLLKWFNWTPSFVYVPIWEDPGANLKQLILPAVILGIQLMAITTRMTRNSVLDVIRQDYVRTAKAKGLSRWRTTAMHTLPNALLPVITIIGVQMGALLSGTAIIEQVFNIPGLGTLLLQAIRQRDYPTVQAMVFLSALTIAIINLAIDLLYMVIDPRVRLA